MRIGEKPAGTPLEPVGGKDTEAADAGKTIDPGRGAAKAGKAAFFGDSFETARAEKAWSATSASIARPSPALAAKPKRPSSGGGFFSWVRGAASRVGSALRGLGTGITSAAVGVVKNLGEAASTLGDGIGQLARGRWTTGLRQIGMAAVKLLQTPVDAGLMLGGRAVSAVQTLIGLEPVGRKLDASEISALRRVYGDSIDYGRVRIKEGSAGLFSVPGRPFTHGDTIYIPPGFSTTGRLLVHEMAHVWQHQNGGTDYMSEALWAQGLGEGYDYEQVLRRGQGWRDMNPEQQAKFLEEAFASGFFDDPSPGRFVHRSSGSDYTAALVDALRDVRAGKGAP